MQQQPCILVPQSKIRETIALPASRGKHMLEPFFSFAIANAFPMKILEDTDVVNDAEVHRHEGDLWFCLEGTVTFVCEGELVDPVARRLPDGSLDEREWSAKEIRGGREVVLEAGDWFWIPPGQPHQHSCKTTGRLVIIKIPQSA